MDRKLHQPARPGHCQLTMWGYFSHSLLRAFTRLTRLLLTSKPTIGVISSVVAMLLTTQRQCHRVQRCAFPSSNSTARTQCVLPTAVRPLQLPAKRLTAQPSSKGSYSVVSAACSPPLLLSLDSTNSNAGFATAARQHDKASRSSRATAVCAVSPTGEDNAQLKTPAFVAADTSALLSSFPWDLPWCDNAAVVPFAADCVLRTACTEETLQCVAQALKLAMESCKAHLSADGESVDKSGSATSSAPMDSCLSKAVVQPAHLLVAFTSGVMMEDDLSFIWESIGIDIDAAYNDHQASTYYTDKALEQGISSNMVHTVSSCHSSFSAAAAEAGHQGHPGAASSTAAATANGSSRADVMHVLCQYLQAPYQAYSSNDECTESSADQKFLKLLLGNGPDASAETGSAFSMPALIIILQAWRWAMLTGTDDLDECTHTIQ